MCTTTNSRLGIIFFRFYKQSIKVCSSSLALRVKFRNLYHCNIAPPRIVTTATVEGEVFFVIVWV